MGIAVLVGVLAVVAVARWPYSPVVGWLGATGWTAVVMVVVIAVSVLIGSVVLGLTGALPTLSR